MSKVSIARRRIDVQSATDSFQQNFIATNRAFSTPPVRLVSESDTPAPAAPERCTLAVPLSTEQNAALQSMAKSQEVTPVAGQILPRAGLIILEISPSHELPDKMLDTNEVAVLLGISRSGVYRLVNNGELVGHRVGHIYRFTREDVQNFLDRSLLQTRRQQ